MDIESAREYCLSMPRATEDMPFGDEDLAIRVEGKIFAFFDLCRPWLMVLKCDPEKALELREEHNGILPAWHWNKKYWNEIYFDRDLNDMLIKELIRHSYREVVKKLPKKVANEINQEFEK